MNVRAILVNVFAQHRCSEVVYMTLVDAFVLSNYDEVKKLQNYDAEYDLVTRIKYKIEHIQDRFEQAHDQALQCLNQLKILREQRRFKSPEYEVTRELVTKSLYQTWADVDQQTFDDRIVVLDDWTDFFVSYTNRDAYATNSRYRDLVSFHFGPPDEARAKPINFVARVIAKLLEQQNIRGFVDYKTLQCGDDIPDRILNYSRRTVAFMQLVEGVTLNEPQPPAKNWCFEEYSAFMNAALPVDTKFGNRCFFALVGDTQLSQPGGGLGELYTAWYEHMERSLHIIIDECNTEPYDVLKSKVREIATQILDAREKLYDAILSPWS